MAMLTLDCARCPAKRMTHDVLSCSANGMEYEYFVRCRACSKTAVWEVAQIANQVTPAKQAESKEGVIDGRVAIVGLVRPRGTSLDAPEHTPPHLKLIFDEGAECMSIGTWNASSAMFRKIVDQISKERMNASPSGPPEDKRTRFNLKPRLGSSRTTYFRKRLSDWQMPY